MSLKPEQLSAALLGAAGSANRILESARERMRSKIVMCTTFILDNATHEIAITT